MHWITETCGWGVVSKHLYATVDLLRTNNGVTKLGVIGFCWGASIALRSGQVHSYCQAIYVSLSADESPWVFPRLLRLKEGFAFYDSGRLV